MSKTRNPSLQNDRSVLGVISKEDKAIKITQNNGNILLSPERIFESIDYKLEYGSWRDDSVLKALATLAENHSPFLSIHIR